MGNRSNPMVWILFFFFKFLIIANLILRRIERTFSLFFLVNSCQSAVKVAALFYCYYIALPCAPTLKPYRRTTITVLLKQIHYNTLPRRWSRISKDALKRNYDKTQDCFKTSVTAVCLEASGSFLKSYAIVLLLCYTNWHSTLSYFRKPDVTRYHKCWTFSRAGRAISRIGHTPFDVVFLRSTWQRVVST